MEPTTIDIVVNAAEAEATLDRITTTLDHIAATLDRIQGSGVFYLHQGEIEFLGTFDQYLAVRAADATVR